MELPAIVILMPMGLIFIVSGLILNAMQAICFLILLPLSKNAYRRFNKIALESLLLKIIFLVDWWARVTVEMHFDPEILKGMGKEHALVVINHRSDIDWAIGWLIAQRAGVLGSTVAIMKDVLKYLPVLGWSTWFAGCIFVKRRWADDESTLKSNFEKLRDFPMPFWLAMFVEGTRFTQAKLADAQKYARENGLPVPRNVLVPRTKGFVLAVKNVRGFVPAIYDVTITVAREEPRPTLMTVFKRKSFVVKVNVKRYSMDELPQSNDGIARWCRDLFVAKDTLLTNYYSGGEFSTYEIQDTRPPVASLLVMIFWSIVTIAVSVGFLLWTKLLSTWEGVLFSAVFLLLVIIIMQILIMCSRSEPNVNSGPVKIPPQDPMKEILIRK